MTADPFASLSPAVRGFATRHGLGPGAVRSDGRVTLSVDGRYRVLLQPTTHHRVAVLSTLMPLPAAGDHQREQALLRLLRLATGMLREQPSTLCIDNARHALMLQQLLPADAGVGEVEDCLADFTNALAFWSRVCAAEAAPA